MFSFFIFQGTLRKKTTLPQKNKNAMCTRAKLPNLQVNKNLLAVVKVFFYNYAKHVGRPHKKPTMR